MTQQQHHKMVRRTRVLNTGPRLKHWHVPIRACPGVWYDPRKEVYDVYYFTNKKSYQALYLGEYLKISDACQAFTTVHAGFKK